MYDNELGVDLGEPLPDLEPDDFDQFENDPVWIHIVHALRHREKVIEQYRDDPSNNDSVMRYMIGSLAGIQEMVNIYKSIKSSTLAADDFDSAIQEQFGASQLESALSAARNGEPQNGYNTFSNEPPNHGRGLNRRYLPGQ